MTVEYEAEVLHRPESAELRFLPEGPYPCGDQRFSWVAIQHGPDAQRGSINVFDIRSNQGRSYPLNGRPGFAFPTERDDLFLVGLERSVQLVHLTSGVEATLVDQVDADVEGTIINDGVLFPDGILFGTKDLEFSAKKAGLYFWRSADRALIRLRDDQICSNGKMVDTSNGDVRLLDIDTPTKTVVEYRLDTAKGELTGERIVVDLRDGESFPDGMIGTPDGQSVIIAFYDPRDSEWGEARQYRIRDGQLEAVWRTMGSPRVTCPQLVRIDNRVELILTTAVEHMSMDQQAKHAFAGALFRAPTPFADFATPPRFHSERLEVEM